MDRERFQRLEELFHQAVRLDPAERAAFLDDGCDGDRELRERVEALVAASSDADEQRGGTGAAGLEMLGADVPERIGPYRVLQEIGRGGFSTVYLAERDDEQFRMRAAIKVVRHGSPDVRRRLRLERQILATLDHPDIARILDGGSTDDGVPYVVMEYIDGQPVDVYCQSHGLELEDRLALFRRICGAVEYAHRNLVLHRDIKPSNILVTADGAPKLLDFGIAKVLHSDTEEPRIVPIPELASTLTHPGLRVLTPEYASPEQVLGRPLTTATDVYSLGVLLYLLLAGERPYRFDGQGWAEIERVVCETVPAPPSAKNSDRRFWRRRRSDDLDTVVLRALAKEPERRYASVEQLSEDVHRYQAGLLVSARMDSWSYRMSRFVARHRAAVATALLVFLTLVSAVVVTTWQAREALEQRRVAEYVADFLENLFEDTSPYNTPDRTLTAREILDRGAGQLGESGDPERQAALAATLGRVYREMNVYGEAERLSRMALDLRRGAGVGQPGDVAESLRDLGVLASEKGDCTAARELLAQAMALELPQLGADSAEHAGTLYHLGKTELNCGDLEAAGEHLRQALPLQRNRFGDESEKVAYTESLLAQLSYEKGDYEEAAKLMEEVRDKRRRIHGPGHPDLAVSLSDMASIAMARSDPAAAVPLYEEALEIQRGSLGEVHGMVAQTHYNLGMARLGLGEWKLAEARFHGALDILHQVYGEAHPLAADCRHELGHLRWRSGDVEAAEDLYRKALEMRRDSLGGEHPLVAQSHLALAKAVAYRDPSQAEEVFRESVALHERLLPPDDHRLAYPLLRLGRLLLSRGDAAAAEAPLRQAVEIRRRALPGTRLTSVAESHLGRSLMEQGKLEEAEEVFEASHENALADLGPDDRWTRNAAESVKNIRLHLEKAGRR